MASLNFILDDVDDQQEAPPSRSNKKGKEPPSAPSAPGVRAQESSTSTRLGHAIATTTQANDNTSTTSASVSGPSSGKRRAATKSAAKGTAAPSSTRPAGGRRRSTTSTDSMDQTGYASSSSMGGPPGHPIRPMPPSGQGENLPIKLTPITGRVSRAKKGVPVHTCDVCRPPKVSRPDRRRQSAHNPNRSRPLRGQSISGKNGLAGPRHKGSQLI
jgi:hypothetical protein